MNSHNRILKKAKYCHTKSSWEAFFEKNRNLILKNHNNKLLEELIRLLSFDKQSPNYDPNTFSMITKACITSLNLEVGKKFCLSGNSITSPIFTIPASEFLLEYGDPQYARALIQKSLRLEGLIERDRQHLEVLLCCAYAQSSQTAKALRLLPKINMNMDISAAIRRRNTDIVMQLARVYFFVGQLPKAINLYRRCSEVFLREKESEKNATALLNIAICFQNLCPVQIDNARFYANESRRISEKYHFRGLIFNSEAFYAIEAYNRGIFSLARKHLRQSLEFLPPEDKSYRRALIYSLLALSYLALGNYKMAKKYGAQTLKFARNDLSHLFSCRYKRIEAELLWENALPIKSQDTLKSAIEQFSSKKIITTDELETYSRFLYQKSILNDQSPNPRINICSTLPSYICSHLNYKLSKAYLFLANDQINKALQYFKEIEISSIKNGSRYWHTFSILGMIQCMLHGKNIDSHFLNLLDQFKSKVERDRESPFRVVLLIVQSAHAYHLGDFKECYRYLKLSFKYSRKSFADDLAIKCWISTIEGKSFRLSEQWKISIVARYTKIYFSPEIKIGKNNTYSVGNKYTVSLQRFPKLDELLRFLLDQGNYSSKLNTIIEQVWQQTTNTQGWQRKIRNSIVRIRKLFPYTIAPIIIYNDDVQLFSKAITIKHPKQSPVAREKEIHNLLKYSNMTSIELSQRLCISKATTKRILRSLIAQEKIQLKRKGRQIFYKSSI